MAAAGSLRLGRGHLGCGLTRAACRWLTIPLVLCSLLVAMAHESWKQEPEETGVHAPEAPIMCINNCGFYGSSMTNSMCSKCFRDLNKQQAEAAAVAQDQEPPKPPTSKSNRCLTCRKKVGLTGFRCRCGGTFCSMHRYADSHRCTFDYKTAAREQIAKQNSVVVAEKINKI